MSKNEITGDNLKTKPASTLYREGWDAIFGEGKKPKSDQQGWVESEDEAAEVYNTAKRGEDEVAQLDKPEQFVVCAAIRDEFNYIICGARHYDGIMRGQIEMDPSVWKGPVEQGFIDQFGKFLTRQEAYVIAEKNGQIIRRVGGDNGKLFSENLY